MTLTLLPASVLVLFGFALFVVGNLAGYTAVATIGGVIVVGVGATVTTQGGLDYRAGETRTITNESANTTVVDVDPEYQPVQTPTHLPLGFLIMLGGALLSIQPLGDGLS